MRMLDGFADLNEEFDPLFNCQMLCITETRDRDSFHEFHDEVGESTICGTGIQDVGDVGMLHQRQCLPLTLEPSNDLAAVHSGLDHLQGNIPPYGLELAR